jgi:glycerophosphoryl diester phosphodiesterase
MIFRSLFVLLVISGMSIHAASSILVHGHRGARAVRPENTLPAFEYAIQIGVDVLELDVAVTKDNVLVVSHDPRMNADYCTPPAGWKGTNVIREMTLEQLKLWDCGAKVNPKFPRQVAVPGTRVPTLDEVYALAGRGKFEFNVETKIFAADGGGDPAAQAGEAGDGAELRFPDAEGGEGDCAGDPVVGVI